MSQKNRRPTTRPRPGRTDLNWVWEEVPNAAAHPEAPSGLQRAWRSPIFAVQLYLMPARNSEGRVECLMVRRRDNEPIRQWRDMQRIKNDLVGPDRTAVEVYPAESDVVDTANMYHLWLLPVGSKLPFGLHMEGLANIAGG